MRYKNRIVLTNSRRVKYTLRSFVSVSIDESENEPLKSCNVEAGFFDNKDIIKNFSIGSKLEVYTKREDEREEKRLFVGVISTVPRVLEGNLKTYSFEATCLLGKTQKVLINEYFEGMTLSNIVHYLIDNYTNFFESKNISVPNNTIVTMEFRDEYLYDALGKVAEAVGGRFEADDEKFIFTDKGSKENETELKRGMFEKGSANFSDDSDNMINFVRGYGDKELTPEFRTETFTANGKSDTFNTKYQPSESKVYVDDVSQRLGTKNLHESGYDVYVDYNKSEFEFVDPPKDGLVVKIEYKYYQRIVVEESDQNSIEEYGMFADVMELKHISDREFLREVLRDKISRYNKPIRTGSINPFYDYWDVSDLIYVNIPDLGIEEHLVCTSKKTDITPGRVKYSLSFEEPPNLTDILKNHLERIRELEKMDDEIEYIDKFRSVQEVIELIDENSYEVIKWENTFRIGLSNIGESI